ncbi:MAG: IPT/TIG domain-containing protein, partial [Ilumatobacteraceae bacterium]
MAGVGESPPERMTDRRTRRVRWGALAALALGVTGVVAPDTSGSTAVALTIGVWVDRGPSNHRITGTALSGDGSIAYTTSDYLDGVQGAGRVMRSTDSTATWSMVSAIPAGEWQSVATSADGSDVIVLGRTASGTSPHRILVSGDGGDTWTDRTPDPDAVYADADITADGSTIVVATPSGVIRSDDRGGNWSTLPGFPLSPEHVTVGRSGASVIVHAAYPGSVRTWRTGDLSATTTLTPAGTVVDLDASDTGQAVLAATRSPHTVQVSTDGGQTWASEAQSGRTNPHLNVAVSGDGSRLALSSYGEQLSESSDGGASWVVADNPDQRAWLALTMAGDGRHVLAGRENQPLRVRIPTPAPTISSITPEAGPVTGGTELIISGTYFHDVGSVEIGGVAATSFTVRSVYEISAVTPPGVAGAAAVTVTTVHGSSTLSDGFTFYATAAPDISAQSVDSGTYLGGQAITLDGTGLAEVTSVTIGDRTAPIVSTSRTQLSVRTPPNRIGLMDIVVESPFGRHVVADGWTSTWEARAPTPPWSEIAARGGYALEVVDDGDRGLYIGGYFLDTAATRWDGGTTPDPVANGVLVGQQMVPELFAFGVQAILPTSDGSVWLGGSLATADGEWPLVRASASPVRTPTQTLDGPHLAALPSGGL